MLSIFDRGRRARQERELERRRLFVEGYSFPLALREKLQDEYEPELTNAQITLVFEGLRSWFLACLYADGRTLGMPSRVVDTAWHEFILMTREYQTFCEEAFGYYLHHSPETTMQEPLGEALARTLAVLESGYPAGAATVAASIPLLFAIDAELEIDDGFAYGPDDLDRLRRRDGLAAAGGCAAGFAGGGDGGGSCAGGSCGGASCGGGG